MDKFEYRWTIAGNKEGWFTLYYNGMGVGTLCLNAANAEEIVQSLNSTNAELSI